MEKNKVEINEIQELLFALIPFWNYKIMKPLKKSLVEGISMEMYYCIQSLRLNEGCMKMSEIAKYMNMSKQQATKLIDKMVENHLVERVYNQKDRRVIMIQETKYAKQYIDYFLTEKVDCYKEFLENMNAKDRIKMKSALQDLFTIFLKSHE